MDGWVDVMGSACATSPLLPWASPNEGAHHKRRIVLASVGVVVLAGLAVGVFALPGGASTKAVAED
jgi:hypothetical protein